MSAFDRLQQQYDELLPEDLYPEDLYLEDGEGEPPEPLDSTSRYGEDLW